MPFLCDRVLVQPTTAQVGAALSDAAHAANRGHASFARGDVVWPRPNYAAVRDAIAGSPAGRHQWPASTRSRGHVCAVAVAWSTDPVGRKHVRVAGWLGPAERLRHLLGPAKRPAWMLVYPDDLYLAEGTKEVVAVCRCGAAGQPADIGWMGRECGPCHDRREAGQAPPGSASPVRSAPPSPGGAVHWLAFLPPGDALLTIGSDRGGYGWPRPLALRRLDLRTGQTTELLAFRGNGAAAAALSPDGGRVVLALEEEIGAFDALSGARLWRASVGAGPIVALAFRPDGSAVAARHLDRVTVHRAADGAVLPDGPTTVLNPLAPVLLYVGHALLAWGCGTQLAASGLAENRPLPRPDREGHRPWGVAGSPDGSLLAVAWDDVIELADVGATVPRLSLPLGAQAVAFSPDGSTLATAGLDGRLRLWSADGRSLGAWSWDGRPLTAVTFSPDGRWLATLTADDGTVKLWPWADLPQA
jgi:hypothetical protein